MLVRILFPFPFYIPNCCFNMKWFTTIQREHNKQHLAKTHTHKSNSNIIYLFSSHPRFSARKPRDVIKQKFFEVFLSFGFRVVKFPFEKHVGNPSNKSHSFPIQQILQLQARIFKHQQAHVSSNAFVIFM